MKTETLYVSFFTVLVTQSCPILCDSIDRSLPGSSARGVF